MKDKINNSKIKPIAIVLVFLMVFQYINIIVPFLKVNAAYIQTFTDSGINWEYNPSDHYSGGFFYPKGIKLSENQDNPLPKEITIPSKFKKPQDTEDTVVEAISVNCFKDLTELEKVTIPEGITTIRR